MVGSSTLVRQLLDTCPIDGVDAGPILSGNRRPKPEQVRSLCPVSTSSRLPGRRYESPLRTITSAWWTAACCHRGDLATSTCRRGPRRRGDRDLRDPDVQAKLGVPRARTGRPGNQLRGKRPVAAPMHTGPSSPTWARSSTTCSGSARGGRSSCGPTTGTCRGAPAPPGRPAASSSRASSATSASSLLPSTARRGAGRPGRGLHGGVQRAEPGRPAARVHGSRMTAFTRQPRARSTSRMSSRRSGSNR